MTARSRAEQDRYGQRLLCWSERFPPSALAAHEGPLPPTLPLVAVAVVEWGRCGGSERSGLGLPAQLLDDGGQRLGIDAALAQTDEESNGGAVQTCVQQQTQLIHYVHRLRGGVQQRGRIGR